MNCIVTAGPTFEPLDEVRRLTNFSTGRLGTELANFLAARGHHVTLLLGTLATHAGERHVSKLKYFTSTADLQAKLKSLAGRKVDAVFHAAAVSDFTFGKVFAETQPGEYAALKRAKKISTRQGALLVELRPTPKIIADLRHWFPRAQIIGWKYEADGGRTTAVRAARRQIADCRTNACVTNGPAYGAGFGLVTTEKLRHVRSRPGLFAALNQFLEPR
jgi:phosphopantothenoylcysteine decarboxylase/phosphopantothenate--cysteine ligase